ncbi:MAG: class I tRNA ligase family protein [Chthoniobacterales bacterium]
MSERRKPYPFDQIEPKWQRHWDEQRSFHTPNPGEENFDASKPKFYILDMFPYPSGAGLHVGHPEGYTATDIVARYKRMRGFNVLHPMGWDAFGLPAEQYAIKTGQHPAVTTGQNIAKFKTQLKRIGFSYDWEREISTADPRYFRWTQWIFLQIYNSWFNPETKRAEPITTYRGDDPDSVRLAYVADVPVNWCPELGTVLANEEVIDGKSEVGGFPVVRRPMRQWMLRITAFAERLIDELDGLDWPAGIKLLQRNWIGRSEGAEIEFPVAHASGLRSAEGRKPEACATLRVFTTRPDTIYGANYMVLAPEHPLVDRLTSDDRRHEVAKYRETVAAKSDLERTDLAKDKTGVFIGAYAINPVNNEKIPIWIADYVLMAYGTGAIMGVPGHDERDLDFARRFNIPIIPVVQAPGKTAEESIGSLEDGIAINSPLIDGLPTADAKKKIVVWLEEHGRGRADVRYKLRDWLFSRQRYWGEPFPIVWRDGKHEALPESELPLDPPPLDDFKPTGTGEPPLAKAKQWIRYSDGAVRETNTMPQWAGSCWYYLRFIDPHNDTRFVGEETERYWMGGDVPEPSLCVFSREEWRRRVNDIVNRALAERGKRPPFVLAYARVSRELSSRIQQVARMETANFYHALDVFAVRHVLKQHGIPASEEQRGLIAIRASDFERLPEILAQPDSVEFGSRHPAGFKRIVLRKQINGVVYVVEEARTRKQQLLLVTMWKKRATARDVTPKAPPSVTSETFRRHESNLSEAEASRKPCGVDLYVGGTEHAVLHLLYARFWHKVLFDLGYLSTPEPFQRLVNQGMILGEDGRKMSKRWGNVIDPLDVIAEYGADSFRCYEMFMGPLEQMKPWSMKGVEGVSRFLARVWRLIMEENQAGEWVLSAEVQEADAPKAQLKVLHATIKKVTEDIEALSFNTALSQMMILVNALTQGRVKSASALRTLLVILNPFAPHLTSELWVTLQWRFGNPEGEITAQAWPRHDEQWLVEDEVEIVVQVNGKVRDKLVVPLDAPEAQLEAAALGSSKVQELTAGKTIRKVVVVPKKLVNVVAN